MCCCVEQGQAVKRHWLLSKGLPCSRSRKVDPTRNSSNEVAVEAVRFLIKDDLNPRICCGGRAVPAISCTPHAYIIFASLFDTIRSRTVNIAQDGFDDPAVKEDGSFYVAQSDQRPRRMHPRATTLTDERPGECPGGGDDPDGNEGAAAE